MNYGLHGWRRKTGYSLLAFAVVLLAAWLRSNVTGDAIVFPIGIRQHAVTSVGGWIYWWGIASEDTQPESAWKPSHQSAKAAILALQVQRTEYQKDPTSKFREWVFSYGALVIPLLLIAGWLILGNRSTPAPQRCQAQ